VLFRRYKIKLKKKFPIKINSNRNEISKGFLRAFQKI
jgi:hypothetical protein